MKQAATQAPADAAATATAPRPETETHAKADADAELSAIRDAANADGAFTVDGETFAAEEVAAFLDPATPLDPRTFNRASRALGFAAVPDSAEYPPEVWREIRKSHDAPLGCREVLSPAGAAWVHWNSRQRVRDAFDAATDALAGIEQRLAWKRAATEAEANARLCCAARFGVYLPATLHSGLADADIPGDKAIRCCLCGREIMQSESANPWPLGGDGDRCCRHCDAAKVQPARLGIGKPDGRPGEADGPETVTLSGDEARGIAAWLRVFLADVAATEGEAGHDAESLVAISRYIATLEGETID
jgi:hypothetical protein